MATTPEDAPRDYSRDTLTETIGTLVRREAEARILIPVIEALGGAFGRRRVIDIVAATIVGLARDQGRDLADAMGGNASGHFLASLDYWSQNDALRITLRRHTPEHLDFDVTRCRYAEMYRSLGTPDLGRVFSCNRDFALIAGFNPEARLVRRQTIMEGAPFCDFRYTFPGKETRAT